MNDLALPGCSPTPLAHYLKALGILRLVSEAAAHGDPTAAGYWQRDTFHLHTRLDRGALIDFFLNHYRPTPILSPWNGDGGFFADSRNAGRESLKRIETSKAPRFGAYRASIEAIRVRVATLGLVNCPEGDAKEQLLAECRNCVPDEALGWIDAAYILTESGPKFPPLLGSGGNDGSLDFSNNHMQHLARLFDLDSGEALAGTKPNLQNSLFAENSSGFSDAKIGQFFPGAAGGPNLSNGSEAGAAFNPWDFILMLEGATLYASAVIKRLESNDQGQPAFPFCVHSTSAGYLSSGADVAGDTRQELWLPLWSHASTPHELKSLFAEGRASIGKRPARDGLDFAQAAINLGVDRGIEAFQRYAFLKRQGKSFLATPLARVPVRRDTEAADLLDNISSWLDSFRRAARNDRTPSPVASACCSLERAIFALCNRGPGKQQAASPVLAVLVQLAACEASLAGCQSWIKRLSEKPGTVPVPLQLSHPGWLRTALAAAPHETALAQALASLAAPRFRTHLEPVDASGFRWSDQAKDVTWIHGRATAALLTTLQRRLILAEGTDLNPLRGQVPAPLASIVRFIEGRLDESLFESLVLALACYRTDALTAHAAPPALSGDELAPSALFALLRTALAGSIPGCANTIPRVPAIVHRAATSDGREASRLAARRLRASGVAPAFDSLDQRGDSVKRTAAAILFPLSPSSLGELLQLIQPIQS